MTTKYVTNNLKQISKYNSLQSNPKNNKKKTHEIRIKFHEYKYFQIDFLRFITYILFII